MATPDEWFRELGRFVNEFEHCCSAARVFIVFYLPGNTHEDQQVKVTVVQNLEAQQLADTVRALLKRTDELDDSRKKLMEDFCALIKQRNIVVHSPWFIGWAAPGESADTEEVVAASPNRKLSGPAWYSRRLRYDQLLEAIMEAERIKTGLLQLGSLS